MAGGYEVEVWCFANVLPYAVLVVWLSTEVEMCVMCVFVCVCVSVCVIYIYMYVCV